MPNYHAHSHELASRLASGTGRTTLNTRKYENINYVCVCTVSRLPDTNNRKLT
jgi:hypothetical protein